MLKDIGMTMLKCTGTSMRNKEQHEGKGKGWTCNNCNMHNPSLYLSIMGCGPARGEPPGGGMAVLPTTFSGVACWGSLYLSIKGFCMLWLLHAHSLPLPSCCSLFLMPSSLLLPAYTASCYYAFLSSLHHLIFSWNGFTLVTSIGVTVS